MPLSTPCTIRLLTSNEVDKKCILAGLRLEQIFFFIEVEKTQIQSID